MKMLLSEAEHRARLSIVPVPESIHTSTLMHDSMDHDSCQQAPQQLPKDVMAR